MAVRIRTWTKILGNRIEKCQWTQTTQPWPERRTRFQIKTAISPLNVNRHACSVSASVTRHARGTSLSVMARGLLAQSRDHAVLKQATGVHNSLAIIIHPRP